MRAPSATAAPRATASDPRCCSVTDQPSDVRIESVRPPPGTVPANVTVPPAAAATAVPGGAPMSTPRCWPPAYGAEPSENGRSTGPATGQVHARAHGAARKSTRNETTSERRTQRPPCCQRWERDPTVAAPSAVVGAENTRKCAERVTKAKRFLHRPAKVRATRRTAA